MARTKECPKCGVDISDSYESAEPDVGIMGSGWYCDACDLPVEDADGPELFGDEVMVSGTGCIPSNRCQNCGSELEAGYGLAGGGGIGPYMYCPNEHCRQPTLIKSQDPEM